MKSETGKLVTFMVHDPAMAATATATTTVPRKALLRDSLPVVVVVIVRSGELVFRDLIPF